MVLHAASVAELLDSLGWRIQRGRVFAGPPGARVNLDLILRHARWGIVATELTWSRKTANRAFHAAEGKLPKYWEHLGEVGARKVGVLGTAACRLHFAVFAKRGEDARFFVNERLRSGYSEESGASKRARDISVLADAEWREKNGDKTRAYVAKSRKRT